MSGTAREEARRDTRMRFEQWAKNPTCEANTFSAVHNVRMADVARHEGLTPTFGRSPFAIARGKTFERQLFGAGGAVLLRELIKTGVLPPGAKGFRDLRLRVTARGPGVRSLDEAIDATRALITEAAAARTPALRRNVPALVAAATVRIPRGVMLPEAVLIVDALAIRYDGGHARLIVGEIKVYPDRGGYTDRLQLASARAQAGLYVHALQLVVAELGLEDNVEMSTDGFLVLTRPGSNNPSIRPREDLRYQAERAARGFELLERAAQRLPGVFDDPDGEGGDERTALFDAVGGCDTAYGEGCLSFCDRAPGCWAAAEAAGNPIILGEDVRRFLGGIRLDRAAEVLGGARCKTPAERDLVKRVAQSDRMAQ